MARRITIEFLGKDMGVGKTANQIDSTTSRLGSKLKSVGKTMAVGLGLGVAAAGAAFVKFGIDSVQSLARIEKINAQTEAAIKSTGGAAGVSAGHVEKLAGKIETLTASEAEAVQEGANLLLTFTNIQNKAGAGNKIFDQATTVMNDMSVAMGTDMKSSAMLVGKALNDPIKGMSALSRAGVQFTDGQKATIEQMVKTGDTMGAQKVILKELETQFGGSGEAFAKTAQGQFELARHKLGEIGETIFTKLMPHLLTLVDWFLNKGLPAFEKFGEWFSTTLPPIFEKVGAVVSKVFGGMSSDTSGTLGTIRGIITNFTAVVRALWDRFGTHIVATLRVAWNTISGVVSGALKIIGGVIKVFAGILTGDWRKAWSGVEDIVQGAWRVITSIVKGALSALKIVMSAAWGVVKDIVRGAWDGIKDIVRAGADRLMDGIRAIPDRIRALGGAFASAGRAIIGAFVDGLKNAAGVIGGIASSVWSALRGMLNSAISRINSALTFTISLPGKNLTINPPDIPMLAKGGIVTRPTLAMIGEAGPEAVVPLTGANARRAGLATSDGEVARFEIPVVVDGQVIQRSLLTLKRRNGGLELGIA